MKKNKKILVEILHPAHVHFFKHAIKIWQNRGDEVLVLSREKECANDLLRAYDIPFKSISKLSTGKPGLIREMLIRDWRMWRECRKFKPDILTGIMGVTIAQIGKLIRKPAVVFYDTEHAKLTNNVVYPLAHSVCTPDCYQGKVNGRHITYPGYHELAYLHPNRFCPDKKILLNNGVNPDNPFFILRLVSWQASHDIGKEGISSSFIRLIVDQLKPHGRVLISSEKPLSADLESFRVTFPPEDMHHYLAHAQLVIGEGATMISEAAVLGTPSFYISNLRLGYTDEEEARYGLVFNLKRNQQQDVLNKLDKILRLPDIRTSFAENRARLLKDKIDTTEWIVEYLDKVMRERP